MMPPASVRERVGDEGREREREPLPLPERSRAARKSYERETDFESEEVDLEWGTMSDLAMNGFEVSCFVFTNESFTLAVAVLVLFVRGLLGDVVDSERLLMPCDSDGVRGVLCSFFRRLLGVFGCLLIIDVEVQGRARRGKARVWVKFNSRDRDLPLSELSRVRSRHHVHPRTVTVTLPLTLTTRAWAATMATAHAHEEGQYTSLVRDVLDRGEQRLDRTGTGTRSLFAPPNLRFSLDDNTLPLLTTKRVFLRGIVEELIWFIRGRTDSSLLSERGIKIWDGNGSRDFLDKRGLSHRREGDLGPVYGFQWRHFGARYKDCDTDYSGQGVDQLREVIRKIKEDPTDRRIILSAWNPAGVFLY